MIQSIVDFLHVPEDPEKVLQRLCQPDVRIVSLTVTEKGYYRTADGHLDETNPLVAEDIKAWTANGLKQPKTALGLICTIAHRRKDAAGPFTVLSCDNLPMNGLTCKTATLEFAAKVDPALAAYLEREIPFPSSMVDRITPVTKPEQIELLKDEYGVEDGWPVVAEPFLQWVVEDKFAAGRPKWEQAASGLNESVLFVEDVEPYELMKLRLLNSSHSAMAYVSLLGGHVFVDEALGDIDVLTFLRAYMAEIVTTLVPVAGVDFIQYRAKLVHSPARKLPSRRRLAAAAATPPPRTIRLAPTAAPRLRPVDDRIARGRDAAATLPPRTIRLAPPAPGGPASPGGRRADGPTRRERRSSASRTRTSRTRWSAWRRTARRSSSRR